MTDTTEIKIDEKNIFEVKNKDLLRWCLPIIEKLYQDILGFKISFPTGKKYYRTLNFLDYLKVEVEG